LNGASRQRSIEPMERVTEPAPECLDCGACCFSSLDDYVRVFGRDHERLGDHADDLVTWRSNRAYLRMESGRCAALQEDVGVTRPRFTCSVYELRPDTCRELERASPACAGERATKAARPVAAAEAASAFRGG
jgi:Fe-S-cluster containining protein